MAPYCSSLVLLLLLGVRSAELASERSWDNPYEISGGNSLDCGLTDEIEGNSRTKVPWVAGIFARTSSLRPYKFLVAGTVIGPSTVITVLGGAYGEATAGGRKYSIPAPGQHRVAVGLSSTNFYERDDNVQIVEVSNIVPYSKHEPDNKHYHLFIFQLRTPLNLTSPYARTACIPLNRATYDGDYYEHAWRSFLRAGSFVGQNNALHAEKKDLKIAKVLLDNNTVCEGEFTQRYGQAGVSEVYCGRLVLGLRQEPLCPSYGTVAVGQKLGRWYMLGILALHPGGANWCGPSTVFFYTKILKPWQWIWDFAGTPGDRFACGNGISIGLNQVCDQKRDCYDARDEDPIYCRGRRPCITPGKGFECGVYGPCLNDELVCNGHMDCPNGEDEDISTCRQALNKKISCPPLEVPSEGLNIICTDKYDEQVPCDTTSSPGTTAYQSCSEFYESSDTNLQGLSQICLETGAWDPPGVLKCKPECGLTGTSNLVPYIVGGKFTSKENAFPWHASIFRTDGKSYKYICGGSLIERNFVVTAAHCIADSPGQIQTELLTVVLGSNTSNVDSIVINHPNAQFFQVTGAWIPPSYDTLTLVSDIALLQLNEFAVLDSSVRPVCYLDGRVKSSPSPGTLGKIPGFGYTEEGKVSESLRYLTYPVVSTFECLASLKESPPVNTFCAGYRNGSSVCQGDSGGGLVFPELVNGVERHVLKGLVSHGDLLAGSSCNSFNYAVFTRVDAYIDWILATLKKAGRTSNNSMAL